MPMPKRLLLSIIPPPLLSMLKAVPDATLLKNPLAESIVGIDASSSTAQAVDVNCKHQPLGRKSIHLVALARSRRLDQKGDKACGSSRIATLDKARGQRDAVESPRPLSAFDAHSGTGRFPRSAP